MKHRPAEQEKRTWDWPTMLATLMCGGWFVAAIVYTVTEWSSK